MTLVGTQIEVEVGAVAHGGHCVARHDGRVVFVRHALPGERVTAQVTEGAEGARFLRADAVEVLEPSPDRVPAPCEYAHPGGCGGCDFQHASMAAQRRLKADVVAEQLQRLAHVETAVEVEAVPGDHEGLGWRTRVRFSVDAEGRAGLRRHRSHDGRCRSTPARSPIRSVAQGGVLDRPGQASASCRSPGSTACRRAGARSPIGVPVGRAPRLTERAAGRDWRVTGAGFWQVHPGAADVLVDAVLDGLGPRPGEHLLDLYAGVGLFAGALAADLGPGGRVDAVEADEGAVRDARRNLHDLPMVRLSHARVDAAGCAAGS